MQDKLKGLSFFSYLSPEQMEKTMFYIEQLELNSGDVLFREGDGDTYISFIITGSLEVIKTTTDQNLTSVIAILDEGACIGGSSLIVHVPRSATVKAHEKTTLAILAQDTFDALVKTEPEIGVNILKGTILSMNENLKLKPNKIIEKVAA